MEIIIVLLTMSHAANREAAKRIQRYSRPLMVAAIGRYEDEVEVLRNNGVTLVFNIYDEAGSGFSDHILQLCSGKPDMTII